MKISVHNIYTDKLSHFEGDVDQVIKQLIDAFPFLYDFHTEQDPSVEGLLRELSRNQAYYVDVEGLNKSEDFADSQIVKDMAGYNFHLTESLKAAQFLAGGRGVSMDVIRQAMDEADSDFDKTALIAYGFEVTTDNLRALRAIKDIGDVNKKEASPVKADNIQAGNEAAEHVADMVRKAFKSGLVLPVKMSGKHTSGMLLAWDTDSDTRWLLKPGSGPQNPAAGMNQSNASQSKREALFYDIAEDWGLENFVPEARLVIVDEKEYAAIRLLSWSYTTLQKERMKDPTFARRLLTYYWAYGILFRWGVLDYVTGNVDRHGGNIMCQGNQVKLIDHGSCFAGSGFDPLDKFSFVPYYLRAFGSPDFAKLPPMEKLRQMPKIHNADEQCLNRWIDGLDLSKLESKIKSYGIDPSPMVERLSRLRNLIAEGVPAHEAIERLWVFPHITGVLV